MKYSEIVDHYGAKHQAIKAVEELNELAVELSKWVNGQGSRKKILDSARTWKLCCGRCRQYSGIGTTGKPIN